MTQLRFYLDENRMETPLLQACASLGLDCVTARQAGQLRREDPEQLRYATADGRALVTENARDFQRLHREYAEAGRSHAGIVIILQYQRLSIGDQARGLRALADSVAAEDMVNRVEFLRGWLGQG